MKYRMRDSFYTDIGPLGNEPGKLDEIAGRIGVLWEPSSAFRALLKVEMAYKDTGGYAYRPFPGSAYAGARTANIRTVDYDSPTRNDEKALQATLELRYEFAGGVTLRSVSGYQNKRIWNLYDSDGANRNRPTYLASLPVSTSDQFVRERMWTQEINLISPTDGALSWILGGYYQRNTIDVDITRHRSFRAPPRCPTPPSPGDGWKLPPSNKESERFTLNPLNISHFQPLTLEHPEIARHSSPQVSKKTGNIAAPGHASNVLAVLTIVLPQFCPNDLPSDIRLDTSNTAQLSRRAQALRSVPSPNCADLGVSPSTIVIRGRQQPTLPCDC